MARNRYRKISVKKIIGIVLVGALLVGILSSFAVFANDTKSAGAIFKVGGLDETTGKYVETDKSIYTERAIDAYGLRVEPDFESTVTYDIYFYDGTDNLLKVVKGLKNVYDEDYEIASKCRIVIHPEIPDDVKEKDFKVRLWEVAKYASMLKITNSKESNGIDYHNLYDKNNVISGSFLNIIPDENNEPTLGGSIYAIDTSEIYAAYSTTPVIELDKNADGIVVFVNLVYPPENWANVFLANAEGKIISARPISSNGVGLGDGWQMLKLSETDIEDAVYARVSYNTACVNDMYIYSFND